MASPKKPSHSHMVPNHHTAICIELRTEEQHAALLPRRSRAPQYLPVNAPLPRKGEIIYLTSTSAWGVHGVVHEWIAHDELRITVFIEPLGRTHHVGRPEFALTQ